MAHGLGTLTTTRLLAALLALLAATGALGCESGGKKPDRKATHEKVVIRGETYELELAIDDAARTRGLMGRDSLPERGGMLFVFPDAQLRSFWMGNCIIDIDIIFLDGQGRITALHRMKADRPRQPNETEETYRARMRSYWSNLPAQFAIELPAGSLDRLDLKVEERIELDLPRLKARVR